MLLDLNYIFFILKNFWWLFLCLFFLLILKPIYLWWIRWEVAYKKRKWIILEIKTPREILKPFKAMEDIFNVLWGIYESPNWRERWLEGVLPKFVQWISFEIASFGGEIHFYWRILESQRNFVESTIYTYYPEAEISVVDDYTKNVPPDIPNEEWDLYGEDYSLMKPDFYPIKTYELFFEEKPEMPEEKRLDPINSLLESLSQLQPAEQFWFQIVACPTTDAEIPWRSKGRQMADKIARRPLPKKPRGFFLQVIDFVLDSIRYLLSFLVFGKPLEEKKAEKKEEVFPPEMKLTPGEKEVLTAIENKIKKHGFLCWIRALYLYRKKEPYFRGNLAIIRNYFHHFKAENLNNLVFWGPTRCKIQYWFKEKRLYLRKRKQFRNYIERMPSTFPWSREGVFPFPHPYSFLPYPKGPGIRGTIVLNAEELATIYHFPSKISIPALKPVEIRKAGPPASLPV